MYSYVNAVLRKRENGARYEEVDISQETLETIFSVYRNGWIELSNPQLAGHVYIDLLELKAAQLPMVLQLTFETWLQSIGSKTIPALPQKPTITTSTILYNDAFKALYTVNRIHPISNPTVSYPTSMKVDLHLSKAGVDMNDLEDYALVTVNGLTHINDVAWGGLRVKDGAKSLDISKQNCVGIMSFKHVGALTKIPLTQNMFGKVNDDALYSQEAYLMLDENLSGKSLMMSIGGYLHVDDGLFEIINHEVGIVKINTHKLNLVYRYFESRGLIDLSSLELTTLTSNDKAISTTEIFSDAVMLKYLTLKQSFAVIVDTPELFKNDLPVSCPGLPGIYESYSEPKYPLRTRFGRIPEYWHSKQDNVHVLRVVDNLSDNFVIDTTPWMGKPVIDDRLTMNDPYDYSVGSLVMIGKDVLS